MTTQPSITAVVANLMLDTAIGAVADSGKLRLYSGTIPTNADTALSGNTLLAELTMGTDSFPSASSGVLTANTITAASSAAATGTAAFFRLFKSDGTTVLLQGTVGTFGTDMTMNSTAIQSGAQVSCSSFTITLPLV